MPPHKLGAQLVDPSQSMGRGIDVSQEFMITA
jgi:hypothetical protein